jgi:D-alanyl-D-alanine carboxypeptidase
MNTPVRFAHLLACLVWAAASAGTLHAGPPSEAPIPAIEKLINESLHEKKAASYAAAVVKDGRLILAKGYGYSDLENDVPATAETVYRLGSITKQFTAMAVMMLAEQGKLSIDDELTKFLPDYPLQEHKVTIGHLLNHTSGIKSYTELPNFRKLSKHDLSRDELLALFKNEPFTFEPGAKWRYNNSGYYLLGVVIDKASGQSYADFLAKNIFRPLNMTATRYGDLNAIIPHRAQGYRPFLGALTNDDPMNMNTPGAAGGLVSNVLDLVKWDQALEAGLLVSASSYEAMYRPTKLADDKTQPYGYGWGLGDLEGHRKISHGGGINGFSTMIARYPDDRLCVIVLSNTAGPLENKIAKLRLGIEDKPIEDLPTDAEMLRPFVGSYQRDEQRVTISSEEGKLYVQPPGRPKNRLKYQGNNTFVPAEDAEVRITFDVKGDRAESFELRNPGGSFRATRVE